MSGSEVFGYNDQCQPLEKPPYVFEPNKLVIANVFLAVIIDLQGRVLVYRRGPKEKFSPDTIDLPSIELPDETFYSVEMRDISLNERLQTLVGFRVSSFDYLGTDRNVGWYKDGLEVRDTRRLFGKVKLKEESPNVPEGWFWVSEEELGEIDNWRRPVIKEAVIYGMVVDLALENDSLGGYPTFSTTLAGDEELQRYMEGDPWDYHNNLSQ